MGKTKQYIQSLNQHNDSLLLEMEKYAEEHRVPIMELDGIAFLKQLIRIYQPQQLLEIGTAIGYSAIQMANASSNVHITTIERDSTRYQDAAHYVKQAGLTEQISIVFDDALEWLEQIPYEQEYDFIFVDAAKGQYQAFVEKINSHLKSGGILVVDNVLFKGYVAKEVNDDSRWQSIGEKINHFNQWLVNHIDYDTTIVETGDGVAIAVKK
ncbi:O-methyltransferase [Alkalibacillus almallahensis]|uniref:O-methyltransferase n=1 Tax=Alkalibacillus almallahensis TaxID=1379154 RepID=UPI00142272DE|nr:O-methyltransferase [Alkalibacillus almallahensis]NIK11290.1 putative O-methyltransferase YrrM [Alkalibacillus almallahensis]